MAECSANFYGHYNKVATANHSSLSTNSVVEGSQNSSSVTAINRRTPSNSSSVSTINRISAAGDSSLTSTNRTLSNPLTATNGVSTSNTQTNRTSSSSTSSAMASSNVPKGLYDEKVSNGLGKDSKFDSISGVNGCRRADTSMKALSASNGAPSLNYDAPSVSNVANSSKYGAPSATNVESASNGASSSNYGAPSRSNSSFRSLDAAIDDCVGSISAGLRIGSADTRRDQMTQNFTNSNHATGSNSSMNGISNVQKISTPANCAPLTNYTAPSNNQSAPLSSTNHPKTILSSSRNPIHNRASATRASSNDHPAAANGVSIATTHLPKSSPFSRANSNASHSSASSAGASRLHNSHSMSSSNSVSTSRTSAQG